MHSNRELCIESAGQVVSISQDEFHVMPRALFLTGSNNVRRKNKAMQPLSIKKSVLCLFCSRNHHLNTCKNITDTEKRVEIVKMNRVCLNCFGSHREADCKSDLNVKSVGDNIIQVYVKQNQKQMRNFNKRPLHILTLKLKIHLNQLDYYTQQEPHDQKYYLKPP